jgi:hypothetical protein
VIGTTRSYACATQAGAQLRTSALSRADTQAPGGCTAGPLHSAWVQIPTSMTAYVVMAPENTANAQELILVQLGSGGTQMLGSTTRLRPWVVRLARWCVLSQHRTLKREQEFA